MSSSAYLHSHSGIERELKLAKRFVLADERFSNLFADVATKPIKRHGIKYLQVPVIVFVERGGVFKNNDE